MEISLDINTTLIYNICIISVLFMYYICIIIHKIERIHKTKDTKPYMSSDNKGLFFITWPRFKPQKRISQNTTYI